MNKDYRELFQPAHTLIGMGCINEIPRYIDTLNVSKALIISDAGLVKVGTVKKVTDVLDQAGKSYEIYVQVVPNPTTAIVKAANEELKKSGCDYIIGIGGGSPLDVAKAVGILAVNGGEIRSYEGVNKSTRPSLPLIAINTTAGTGSEVTRDYVITDEEKKIKMLMVDSNCLSTLAIDDPQLMLEMPPHLTAATGMDALTHAIEAYVCKSNFPYSNGLALEAIALVSKSLKKAVFEGNDIEARTNMCWAEYMAGLAFSNSGLGLVHAMAHQLGGFYNMPHGVANAILLPYVMEYNSLVCKERYAAIAKALGIKTGSMTADQASNAAIQFIKDLSDELNIPTLHSLGFQPGDVITLSLNALNDTCLTDNPRTPSLVDVQNVYMNAYEGR